MLQMKSVSLYNTKISHRLSVLKVTTKWLRRRITQNRLIYYCYGIRRFVIIVSVIIQSARPYKRQQQQNTEHVKSIFISFVRFVELTVFHTTFIVCVVVVLLKNNLYHITSYKDFHITSFYLCFMIIFFLFIYVQIYYMYNPFCCVCVLTSSSGRGAHEQLACRPRMVDNRSCQSLFCLASAYESSTLRFIYYFFLYLSGVHLAETRKTHMWITVNIRSIFFTIDVFLLFIQFFIRLDGCYATDRFESSLLLQLSSL